MVKKYKIYERVETSLESRTVTVDYYDMKSTSFLLRGIVLQRWYKNDQLADGFLTLEEAEKFIEENIEDYDNWIIITEYSK